MFSAPAPYVYEQTWGEHVYRVEGTGTSARVLVDGALLQESPCGVRLITTPEGRLLRTVEIE